MPTNTISNLTLLLLAFTFSLNLFTLLLQFQPNLLHRSHSHAATVIQTDIPNPTLVSPSLFASLEESSRLVDITYCIGSSGVRPPFTCLSHCSDFPDLTLIKTWNTGPLLADSCGYIAIDHSTRRIIVAFRGTYSLINTLYDLSTSKQEYVPYLGSGNGTRQGDEKTEVRCENCTVHSGFYTAWQNTRDEIMPLLLETTSAYPSYTLHLLGHSLGGALAALSGLELSNLNPVVTTFGEPRIGNVGLRNYLDMLFDLRQAENSTHIDEREKNGRRYRRVTHINDPIPLLPLTEWGFRPHAGEIFITKPSLPPDVNDVIHCKDDEDLHCIAGQDSETLATLALLQRNKALPKQDKQNLDSASWGLPARYKMWQLLGAHRAYFWRLGLCVPGGDPFDWGRGKYGDGGGDEEL